MFNADRFDRRANGSRLNKDPSIARRDRRDRHARYSGSQGARWPDNPRIRWVQLFKIHRPRRPDIKPTIGRSAYIECKAPISLRPVNGGSERGYSPPYTAPNSTTDGQDTVDQRMLRVQAWRSDGSRQTRLRAAPAVEERGFDSVKGGKAAASVMISAPRTPLNDRQMKMPKK